MVLPLLWMFLPVVLVSVMVPRQNLPGHIVSVIPVFLLMSKVILLPNTAGNSLQGMLVMDEEGNLIYGPFGYPIVVLEE